MEEKNISEKVRKSVVKEFLSKTRKYREESVFDGEYNNDLDKHIYRSLGGKVEINGLENYSFWISMMLIHFLKRNYLNLNS